MPYYILEQGKPLAEVDTGRPFKDSFEALAEAKALKKRKGRQYSVIEIRQWHTTQELGEILEGKGW